MPHNSDGLRHQLQADTKTDNESGPLGGSFLVPGLTVLHHPDAGRVGERVALTSLAAGREEVLSRKEPAFSQPGREFLRPLADPHLSRQPIRLVPGSEPGGVRLLCSGTRTAVAINGEVVAGERELSPGEVESGAVLLLASRVVVLLSLIDPLLPFLPDFGLIGESAPMFRLRQEIRRVAGLDVPVLLRGETGTGKELVARAL
ncbi:MAG TPA: sigma 54-interacting transcriptional regulator, partial [Thermoanaerobaculia bacterium]|nr:sigma 54-interacting transcriptional regulator [Thermoanaerobaculia bacterium]